MQPFVTFIESVTIKLTTACEGNNQVHLVQNEDHMTVGLLSVCELGYS